MFISSSISIIINHENNNNKKKNIKLGGQMDSRTHAFIQSCTGNRCVTHPALHMYGQSPY